MEEMNKPVDPADDTITLKDVLSRLKEWRKYILPKWGIILIAGIIGGGLGITYAWFKKPIYKSVLTFVIEEEGKSGGLGAYAGLASQFGLDIGGAGANGLFSGDNIIEFFKSRSIVEQTLLTDGDFNGKKELLVDRYISFNKLRDKWKDKPELKDLTFPTDRKGYSLKQDSVLGTIYQAIMKTSLKVEKLDKKLNIIKVSFDAQDELFAKKFAEALVSNVGRLYTATKTKKTAQNLAILQNQTDSVRRELNSAITGVAVSVDATPNANPTRQVSRVPSQRRGVDAQVLGAAYTELVKNLEITKISLRKETPLIQVIDKPILPLERDALGKVKGLVIGGFLFGFLMVAYLTMRMIFKNLLSE